MADQIKVPTAQQAAAAATAVLAIGEIPTTDEDAVIATRAEFVPSAAVVGTANPNNATINVRIVRAGVVGATVASKVIDASVNVAAEQPIVLTLTTPPTAINPGDVLDVQMVQNGTGLLIPAGTLEVEYE